MPTRDEDVALPPEVLAAAEELRKREGVVGVFWGDRYKESERRWIPERTLCVHVQKKRQKDALAASEFIQPTFRGFRTDVLEVGRIVAHSVTVRDRVDTGGPLSRSSTITALASIDGVPHALLSGHGTLPVSNGKKIRSSYLYSGASDAYQGTVDLDSSGNPEQIFIHDGSRRVSGQLLFGKIGGSRSVDFALAKLDSDDVDPGHPAMAAHSHFEITSTPAADEKLSHYSRLHKDGRRYGIYKSIAATDFEVHLPDGSTRLYADAYVVESSDREPFSQLGDSGSAVVDSRKRVVGTILGGSTSKPISYVLPIGFLYPYLEHEIFLSFFSEK